MGDLISRTDALDAVRNYFKSKLDNISGDRETAIETILDDNAEIYAKILAVPSVEAIPLDGAYIKQIRWERDVALQQLEEIGCGLGRDMTDIKKTLENNRESMKRILDRLEVTESYSCSPQFNKAIDRAIDIVREELGTEEPYLTNTDTYDSDFTVEEIEEQTREHFKQLEEECRQKTELERILERLDKELSMHKISPNFHPEHTEGVRWGLSKAIEIIKEEMG